MVKMITIAELAAAWGVSRQRVWQLRERIPGGQCAGGTAWIFPARTNDPAVRDAITEIRYRRKGPLTCSPMPVSPLRWRR